MIAALAFGLSVGITIAVLVIIAPATDKNKERINELERILNEHGIDDDGGLR